MFHLLLPICVAALLPGGAMAETSVIRWPDADIALPPEVRSFIIAECNQFRGTSQEDLPSCYRGEAYGYRAVVMMLMDEQDGDIAAERYRACRAGLQAEGGRFHRRRAECIGSTFHYHWRFVFNRRASLGDRLSDRAFASNGGEIRHPEF